MLVTLDGIVTFCKELQLRNASEPMLVMLDGFITFCRELHPLKLMDVTGTLRLPRQTLSYG